jgi:hypothetical protein
MQQHQTRLHKDAIPSIRLELNHKINIHATTVLQAGHALNGLPMELILQRTAAQAGTSADSCLPGATFAHS